MLIEIRLSCRVGVKYLFGYRWMRFGLLFALRRWGFCIKDGWLIGVLALGRFIEMIGGGFT